MKPSFAALILLAGLPVVAGSRAQTPAPAGLAWTPVQTGVTATLRGISAASDRVVWASGSGGTVIRTQDGGKTWKTLPVPGGSELDFRDIDAFDANIAYVLSAGPGEASRIFRTIDGGATWIPQFRNMNAKAFFDAMAFADPRRGLALSDSVDGQFVLFHTADGERWARVPPDALPAALPNEGAFAASGTNLTFEGNDVWIGTSAARVIRTTDRGRTWTAVQTPLATGPSAGIFSIAFRDRQRGIVVGGDYKKETDATDTGALTNDGGATWTKLTGLGGFRSAVSYVPAVADFVIAVGPSGSDYSTDGGQTWRAIPGPGFHTLSVPRRGRVVWAGGGGGVVASLTIPNR
jgi:photosystem II stability/assembly factor-like uncharacterized protein